jgi:hypothetical protein
VEDLIPARLIGLQGCLSQPLWGGMGVLAVFCGALASNQIQWNGEGILTLLLVLLLSGLGWGSIWNLAVGVDWFPSLAEHWPPVRQVSLPSLPYTLPGSPGGRLARWLGQLVGWWRESFAATHRLALTGLMSAVVVTAVLSLILPDRIRFLNAAVVALVGIGGAQRLRGTSPLAALALLQVGLGWLAGHLAFAEMNVVSWVVALSFTLAVLGVLRVGEGLPGGLWLLNGGQIAIVILLVALKQPLAGGVVGMFLLGQIALQPSLHLDDGAVCTVFCRRSWPWLMGAMLVAALVIP